MSCIATLLCAWAWYSHSRIFGTIDRLYIMCICWLSSMQKQDLGTLHASSFVLLFTWSSQVSTINLFVYVLEVYLLASNTPASCKWLFCDCTPTSKSSHWYCIKRKGQGSWSHWFLDATVKKWHHLFLALRIIYRYPGLCPLIHKDGLHQTFYCAYEW